MMSNSFEEEIEVIEADAVTGEPRAISRGARGQLILTNRKRLR